jgi:REP element-mobilizing transposase RayT
MSAPNRTSANDVFFVTLTVVGWVDLFSRVCYKNILIENLEYCQKNESLEIFAYVIMSNHLHMICRRRDADLGEMLGRFKGYTSKRFIESINNNPQESRSEWMLKLFQNFAATNKQYGKHHIWQQNNLPIQVYSPAVFQQKQDYIHLNPVRAGIVARPEFYLHSSACPDSPLIVNPT